MTSPTNSRGSLPSTTAEAPSLAGRGTRDDRQDHARGMIGVVVDRLLGDGHLGRLAQRRARVQVAVELGKGAGGDLHADAMSRAEDLAGVPAINAKLIDAPRLDQRRAIHPLAEARPRHAVT